MTRLTGATALALCAFAAPALADVTPQQVWDDLEAYLGGFGYTIDATETMDGNTLIVSDATIGLPLPEEEGSVTFTMDTVTFTDNGDGTVSVTFPPVMPIQIALEADDETVDMTIEYTHQDLAMIVSGDDTRTEYDITAASLAMRLASLVVEGQEITRDMARFDVTMGPLDGTSVMTRDAGLMAIEQDMNLGDLTYNFAANDPESDEGGVFSGSLNGLAMAGNSTIPEAVDMADMAAALAAGFAGSGEFTHQGGQMEFSVIDDKGTTSGQTSSTSGRFSVSLSEDALDYAVGGTGTTLALTTPDLPFPINAQMAESAFSFKLPVQPGDAPQDAAFGLTLGGFSMSEMLWNIFDPAGALPRDPATVALALTAKVSPTVNLMDPEALEEIGDEPPGELHALTLTDLEIDAVGGRITGEGSFTFDNSDLETFDGLPRPEGQVTLNVAGANALIDKLIAMGLMQEQDAMGARMMLSMFTVPGSEPDTATSTITVNAQGHVLANGQRIK